MGCEGEMRPAARTVDPDKCIISRYCSTIKHLHTQSGTGPRALRVPPTPPEQRENAVGVNDCRGTRAFSVSDVRLSGFLLL